MSYMQETVHCSAVNSTEVSYSPISTRVLHLCEKRC